ncbi:hypothetical protein Xoosp13_274 [Xanthomonas phage Xoo-sp13]|nr:hypothetical protein Xoosp13_274 [Xanthomonas phage Xoo-sp13]
MKIQSILNEDFAPTTPPTATDDTGAAPQTPVEDGGDSLRFNDLSAAQVGTLKRIASGAIDVDSASDSDYDTMVELADLGLLDQEYNVNERGQKVIAIAKRLGGSSDILAARAKQDKLRGGAGAPQVTNDGGLDTADLGNDVPPAEDSELDDDGEYDFRLNR